MTEHSTQHWLDLYDLTLEALAGALADPKKFYDNLGIKADQPGAQMVQGKLSMEQYRELRASWKRVRADMLRFGLVLGEELEMEPLPAIMGRKQWQNAPWLVVAHQGERNGLRFTGRDAFTAFGFLNFFIQLSDSVNPAARIREVLTSQGINKDNFDLMVGKGTGIKNPWQADPPASGSSNLIIP